ncbi:hypothetical protein UPYG_G00220770 [Umbra pygmaea]|uniref:Uncharacterized protein n=1 Tax=Umbra pygmaea TaxID=75934 RepID=A0ABD0WG72_UMBPY
MVRNNAQHSLLNLVVLEKYLDVWVGVDFTSRTSNFELENNYFASSNTHLNLQVFLIMVKQSRFLTQ